MPTKKRVLITGASGLIGGVLRAALSEAYELSGVDRVPVPGLDVAVGDMTNLEAVGPAFEGVDVVIDLAAVASDRSPWDVVYANNVPSTYNALEAARRGGAKRLIFASSNHVTGAYEDDHPYSAIVAGRYEGLDPKAIPRVSTAMPIRPDGPYGVVKAFGEAAGRYYSDRHGLSVLCMRIGSLVKESRPRTVRHFATLLTHRDLVHLVTQCVEAPPRVGFGIFYGVSNNTWRFWDIGDSADAIGYHPRDDAESWRDES